MKIFIAGSMHFAKEILRAEKIIKELGHEVYFAPDTRDCLLNPYLNEDLEHCNNTNIMRSCMDEQEKCDAILLLNHTKEGIDGYIGANSLIELGIAYYLKQKIFLLNNIPPKEKARLHTEVTLLKPIILNGEIKNIMMHI
jgi:nucleoside 2-deoxyribosyltransferase